MPQERITKYNAVVIINDILSHASNCLHCEFDELLDTVLQTVNRAMDAQASSILLVNADNNVLFFKSATGSKAHDVMNYKLELGKGIAGWVAQTGEPLLVPDVTRDSRWDPTIATLLGFPTQSMICVPLITDNQSLGVIEVINSLETDAFDEEDLGFMVAIAEPIAFTIRNARMVSSMRRENTALKNLLGLKQRIIGESEQLQQVLDIVEKVSRTNVAVLIEGETGTGKELIARTIHENSNRSTGPFIAVNCAAIPESLIEAELFGHEKGSFTDATESKQGKFEMAHKGTLFLDEIGDMSLSAQSKVLRAIQEQQFLKVGGTELVKVDVRIISATNRNLKQDTQHHTFREDLYYRLNEFNIPLPPLRDRKSDIPALVSNFIELCNVELGKAVQGVSHTALKALMAYHWPGNIRELRNVIRRTMILVDSDWIDHGDVQLPVTRESSPQTSDSEPISLKDMERRHIVRILRYAKGKSRAAQLLDISRPTLDKKIRDYGLESIVAEMRSTS